MRSATVLFSLFLLAPAMGEESPGQRLAKELETEADPKRRATLLKRIDLLEESERAALVRWASDHRRKTGGWTGLAQALVKIGSPAAVEELGLAAAAGTESAEAARKGLLELPADVALPQLVRGLVLPDRRSQAFYREALLKPLTADAGRFMAAFRRAQMTWPEEDRPEADGVLTGLVQDAVTQAPAGKDRLIGSLRNMDEVPVAIGLAHGIREAAATRRRAAAESDPEAGAMTAEMDGDWLPILVELLERESPAVLIAACDAVRVVVWHVGPEDPDGAWVRPLFRLIEHEDKLVSLASWKALQGITGDETVQQSREAWQAWWNLHRGGLDDEN